MINKSFAQDWLARSFAGMVMIVGLFLCQATNAADITLSVEASNPDTTGDPLAVAGFRYMVEEDTTYKPDLNVQDDYGSLSFQFHRSHNPVATDAITGQGISGFSDTSSAVITVPDNGRYFISVTPFEGHAMGGGSVEVGTDPVAKTIRVNTFPLPTAQISIWIFEDNNPVNGALDLDESRLATTDIDGQAIPFTINLFDAAGQYGAAGGHVTQDAYGNPLGTEYAPNGDVTSTPDNTNGFVLTPNANGELIIKHLPPAKYGVQVVPPAGPVGEPIWVQTSTIEGSRTIDAWVKAGEPETFVEFGPPGPHVFVGFVQTFDCLAGDNAAANCFDTVIVDGDPEQVPVIEAGGDGATINGQIVNNHMSRPPAFDFANGEPFGGCRVAVNIGIAGRTIYSQPCDENSMFSVAGLPVGSYSLSIWDDGLNIVIANHAFNVVGNATDGFSVSPANQLVTPVLGTLPATVECDGVNCELGQIPVFDWFHFADTSIFVDTNENGFWDTDEKPMNADASETILRFRDGRVYGGLPIDFEGAAPIEEIFPFFHWLVAEVGFANHKATGATFIVDAGGDGPTLQADGYVAQQQTVPDCGTEPLNQPEDCTFDGGQSRTETGQVLTAAFQGFLGQKNIMQFGKKAYEPGENGGISGVAIYAITRAEDDPAYAAAEEWEPGIPRVQVALFNSNRDETIEDNDGTAGVQQPDVDNHPLGWGDGTAAKGPEDIDRNSDGVFDYGDAIDVTWTDSWDDSQPQNCGGANQFYATPGDPSTAIIPDDRCFDGLRNFNQIRPGVFDGGYAFGGTAPHLPSGYYIVQAYTPPGYELMREEHKNVDFGDEYAVSTLLPPPCVGDEHIVPDLLAFVTVPDPDDLDGDGKLFRQVYDIGNTADYEAPYAGLPRRLCDARHIRVADSKNAAADFHFMTPVSKAAHVVGGVINDLGNEFNPLAPTFGEKFAPPWVPVAFYDYKGHEITRVYSDQFGKYNAMLPSTNTVNIASPSGVAPNMVTACMNDGGLVDTDGDGVRDAIDPNYNPQYSQFCYVFQYMPGATTYLDTPVQQIAAFAGPGLQLDCAAANQTPLISEVTSEDFAGPYAQAIGNTVTIKSPGKQLVPNPSSDELTEKLIVRDYGFGDAPGGLGKVQMIRENNIAHAFDMTVTSWTDTEITVQVPLPSNGGASGRFQLVVTNAAGFSSPMGVTLTVRGYGNRNYLSRVHEVFPSQSDNATPIQDAIDAARPGDTILVTAGTYNEIPIMWKPVYLQGAGAYSTTINARSAPTEIVEQWHAKMDSLLELFLFDLLPGQEDGPGLFATDAAAGVTVVAPQFGSGSFANSNNQRSRIDGFKITGASTGGGIFVNGYADYLYVSNNLITGNQGTFSGGVRLGHPTLVADVNGQLVHDDANNDSIRIRHNMITQNGGLNGAGGGISIYTGADDYRVNNNLICGNFASTDGAGIGHLGESARGRIEDNTIIFNQSFRQTPGFETDGGGILIAGKAGLNGSALSSGSGHDIRIDRNLIQGNQAGAGDGGGIALRSVNGTDIDDEPDSASQWNRILIRNNSLVNNMAGLAGGGISLRDAVRVNIQHNTIANNESTATAGAAFETDPEISTPQPAGIAARAHSPAVGDAIEVTNARYGRGYSSPVLTDNIVWHNRSNHYELNTNEIVFDVYSDLGILPAPANANWRLTPRASLLSDATGYNNDNLDDGDVAGTQVFVEAYLNGSAQIGPSPLEFNTIQVAPALDEGGNWLDVRYAPLSINDIDASDGSASFGSAGSDTPSDYHLFAGSGTDPASVAIDSATGGRSGSDIDRDPLGVSGAGLDMGSDEVQ